MSGKVALKYPPFQLATGDESTARRRNDVVAEPPLRLNAFRGRFSLVRDSYLATLLTIPGIFIVATQYKAPSLRGFDRSKRVLDRTLA